MSAQWVAGNVRAKALLNRRIGIARARELAGSPSLAAAQRALADSPYRRTVAVGQLLEESEYGLGAVLLWQLRVLAGWQPRAGAGAIRLLAGGFEVANVCSHARMLSGAAPERSFEAGALSIAWSRLRETTSLTELRRGLAQSAWGDPGGDSPSDIAVGVQLGWAHLVATGVPEAADWAVGAAALLVARHRLVEHRGLTDAAGRVAARLLGATAVSAADLPAFAAGLPARAGWALTGVASIEDLWRAEFQWWTTVDQAGQALLRHPRFDAAVPIGAVAVLAADTWRCRAALQLAAGGGAPIEVYDALV
ncbi:hypothetical protein ABZ942_19470 [Nocardia sp. NPDC046473]|uniref:hypothetical protein n=1 Tax=Nocardia sp. NPDC046473 TaxID=3155733 RepID=UPI0033EA77E3